MRLIRFMARESARLWKIIRGLMSGHPSPPPPGPSAEGQLSEANRKTVPEARIIKDPVSGLPVLTTGPGNPEVTSEQVAAILVDFP